MFTSRLGSILRATFILGLAVLLTALVCLPVYLLILLKLLVPSWRTRLAVEITQFCARWADGMVWIQKHLLPTRWDIRVEGALSPTTSCLVIANHQSWIDVLVLLVVMARRVPFPRFFLKHQLLFLPLIGPVSGDWTTPRCAVTAASFSRVTPRALDGTSRPCGACAGATSVSRCRSSISRRERA